MRETDFINLEQSKKKIIFDAVSDKTGLPPQAIEKDWWVTLILKNVFSLGIKNKIQFKGGTSLSKCWHIIDRFSEDIDLAIDREFLGFGGELSKNQISDKLRRKSKEYIIQSFLPALQEQLRKQGVSDRLIISTNANDISTQDPIQIYLEYKSIYGDDEYIRPVVMLEVSGRSNDICLAQIKIDSIINESLPDKKFETRKISVTAVRPERTFIEKICLLHEEFSKSEEKMRHLRMSRHLYDIYKMCDFGIDKIALRNENLFTEIIRHRFKFNRIDGVDYNTERPGQFNIVPPVSVIKLWEKDYNLTMSNMIFSNDKPSFESMLKRIKELNESLNRLQWKTVPDFSKGNQPKR